jgi:saccharopine dehydrogenase (NAD+, L-lysine forming)
MPTRASRPASVLLRRFRAGGGTLYDLEYLVDETGPPRRGLRLLGGLCGRGGGAEGLGGAGRGRICGPVARQPSRDALLAGAARGGRAAAAPTC